MSPVRIVIVGAGFAGYRAARTLSRLPRGPGRHHPAQPDRLLPVSAAAAPGRRRHPGAAPGHRLPAGHAAGRPAGARRGRRIDLDGRTVHYTDPEGDAARSPTTGWCSPPAASTSCCPIPGVAEHAHGFRGLPEALYLRDHVTRQVELAAAADARRVRRAVHLRGGRRRLHRHRGRRAGQLFTDAQVRRAPAAAGHAAALDPPRHGAAGAARAGRATVPTADRVLRGGVWRCALGTSVKEATRTGSCSTDGEFVADPDTGVVRRRTARPARRGPRAARWSTGTAARRPALGVPGRPEVFACGDAAAVPDLKPGRATRR